MSSKRKNRKEAREHYPDLDAVRSLSCAAVLLYHLGVLKGGYLAVCTFFVLSGFLSVTSAYGNKKFPVKDHCIKRLTRTYLPLVAVTLMTVAAVSAFPSINWLNLKPETKSVLLGYNNWWQLGASADYFARHISSPFMHFWYAAIQLQFDLCFPALYFLMKKAEEKEGKDAPALLLGLGIFLSALYMALLYKSGSVMSAYYGTFSRAHALLAGMLAGLIHRNRQNEHRTGSKAKGTVFALCTAAWAAMVLFCSDTAGAPALAGATVLSFLMVLTGARVRAGRPWDKAAAAVSGMSYEIYLVQYPVIYLVQETAGSMSPLLTVLQAMLTAVAAFLLNTAEKVKPFREVNGRKKAATALFAVLAVLSLCGAVIFARAEDHTSEMKELEEQLSLISADMEARQAEALERRQQEEDAWEAVLAELQSGDAGLEEAVSQLPVVGIGDSVMLGALPSLYDRFPNGYFDAAKNRTAYVANGILSSIESRGLMGDVVVLNFGANGAAPDRINESIMERLQGKKVFWLTNTNKSTLWVNDRLRELAERWDNLTVVDWYSISRGHDEYFAADKLHLTYSGREAFVGAVFDAICAEYREEWQRRIDEAVAEHEEQERRKTGFFGNDLLTGIYPFLDPALQEAEISVNGLRGDELVDAVIKAEESGEIPHRAVFAFDSSARLRRDDYERIASACAGHELYIVDLSGELAGMPDVTAIDISDMDPRGDMYMPDRVHLSEKGSSALAQRIGDELLGEGS